MTGVELIVGGWFASAIINKLIDKARTYFGDNQDLHSSSKDMLNQLETSLPQIQSVIDLAERRPIANPSLSSWLRQLKDVVYEADDVLDDLEARHLRHDKKGKSKVSGLASTLKHFVSSDDDLKNLKSILKKLDRIASGVGNFIQLLNLEMKESKQKTVISVGETSSLLSDDMLFGRDNEREAILELLFPNSSDEPDQSHAKLGEKKLGAVSSSHLGLRVLPIVGMGGVGKTALARLIYNHVDTVEVNAHFEVKTWVYVSNNSDVKKITEQMMHNLVSCSPFDDAIWDVESIKGFNSDSTTLDAVQVRLRDFLINKKFLIILDDVWDEMGAIWDRLRSPLIRGAEGSVVLVTTQSRRTADMIGTVGPIVLDVLEENDYTQLFEHFAFGAKEIEAAKLKELQSIGRRIASKLHGLPLAGKALGRLLQSNLDVDYWTRVLESEWWEIDVGLNKILPSLGLSFEHLGANLKQCFAYCSIFPEGYIFKKDTLVQMWMAQGYIQPDERKRRRIEDIGIEWFDELTSRSFFQHTWNERFVMHDVMRELAVYVSLEECFVLKDESKGMPQGIRHLSLRTDSLHVLIEEMDKLKCLRTILFFGDYDSDKFVHVLECLFEKSRSLRVLDLSYSRMRIKALPNDIAGLSHLRYFDLSYTKIECLPETVSGLSHLQVLNLQGCGLRNLPKGINNLIKLRYLYGDSDTLSLVAGIGKLTCLQELEEFRVKTDQGHQIRELKHMRELRGSLDIKALGKVASKEEAMSTMLTDKEHLHTLRLSWFSGGGNYHQAVLEGLQPHCNIKEIDISGYDGVISPTWMTDSLCLSNLRHLHLFSCGRWNSLPPLGQLPLLEVLHIEKMDSVNHVDSRFYGSKDVVFPSLEKLVLRDMDACEEWSEVEAGRIMFPRLRKLHIIECKNLRGFPLSRLNPSSLVELVIARCGNLDRALLRYLQSLTSLSTLEISDYPHETSLDLSSLLSLQELHVSGCEELRLLEGLHSLISLKMLQIVGCPHLKLTLAPRVEVSNEEAKRSPTGGKGLAHRLASLTALSIKGILQWGRQLAGHEMKHHRACDQQQQLQANPASHTYSLQVLTHLNIDGSFLINRGLSVIGEVPRLKVLHISHYRHYWFNDEQEQIEWFRHLTSLKELFFSECKLEDLPFHHMEISPPSLKKLTFESCDYLLDLDSLPLSLKELHILQCLNLEEQCRSNWHKILYIPYIRINGETIQML